MSSVFKSIFLLVAFTVALVAHAQSVRWEPSGGTLAFNQLSELRLVFEQCEPEGTVALPEIPGLSVSQPPNRGENASFSVINGKASRSRTVILSYRVRPTERLNVSIPAFKVKTDKGELEVPHVSFAVGDATVGQSNVSLENIARSGFTLPADAVWAGEVFPITYSIGAARRYLYQLGSEPEWNSAPLSVEPWGKPEQFETEVNNEPRISIVYKARAYAKNEGTITLNPATQLVNLATGNSGFSIFARPSLEQFSITSQPAKLVVRPLPVPAPAGFSGAVGKFTLESQVVPAKAAVGEPVTWTLTLDGTGNWPDIAGLPPRAVSKDFRPITPQAKRVNKNGALFDATLSEDVVLIPTRAGTYTLGPVSFTVFDPSSGRYETLTTKPFTVVVAPAAGQPASQAPAASTPSSAPSASAPTPAPAPIQPPSALPGDPLAASGAAFAPVSVRVLVLGLLSSALLPLIVWITLAMRRARRTDPALPLREARARLADTLRRIDPATPDERLLRAWQSDVAILFRLARAVPVPAHFADPAWAALWAESERALYGNAPLPADWVSRATAALASCRVPAFNAFQLFLPRNLLPLVAVLSIFAAGLPSEASAKDEKDAYASADYPSAEKAWRKAVEAAPTDWIARHNLSLALSQQNRSGEAAAQALAAFVQSPRAEAARRQLDYAFKTASIAPPPVGARSAPDAWLAALASPAAWQAAFVAAAWFAALALALKIAAAYRRAPRSPLRHLSTALLIASVLVSVAGGVALHAYGPLADPRAVVVSGPSALRSIPTDLDTQKTSTLRTGSVAVADKTFLGWTRLRFPDGQTGWARTEALTPLWR